MFKRDNGPMGGETIIAQGVKVEGEFTSSGDVIVEGEVAGSVVVAGDLRVGEQAKIQADVKARNATVAGEVQGNLSVEEKLDLSATSRLTGDLEAQVLIVAPGAILNGKISMGGVPNTESPEKE